MSYIINNWYLIVTTLSFVGLIGIGIYKFISAPSQKQINQVKEWLLWAVVQAEKELGSKTGKIKLRLVFDMFLQRFPDLAKYITFEMFSKWVDDALIQMQTLLRTNNAVKQLIEK